MFQAGCEQTSYPVQPESSLGRLESEIKIANSLSTQDLVFNGISTNARANRLVRTNALGALFNATGEDGAYIRNQLLDPSARKFMEYLVSCALGKGQQLGWYSSGSHAGTWNGNAGLCTAWLNQAPSETCLTLVSSCILALNNALDRRVEVSLRGKDSQGNAVGLEPQPFLVEYDPDVSADLAAVESFLPCQSSNTDLARKCGWSRGYIGQCTPGSTIWVGAGGNISSANKCTTSILGSSPSDGAMLRVCDGIVGCDSGGKRFVQAGQSSCGGTNKPAFSFPCPGSGYFNVMKAPRNPSQPPGQVNVAVEQTSAAYPLPEAQVFRVREGAFYGNLFTEGVRAEVTVIPSPTEQDGTQEISVPKFSGSVYPKLYACHDPEWRAGYAYAAHRVCALPYGNFNCAATVVGACNRFCTEAQGDGSYSGCKDLNGLTWSNPVTTFINSSCDLMPPGQPGLCARRPQVCSSLTAQGLSP